MNLVKAINDHNRLSGKQIGIALDDEFQRNNPGNITSIKEALQQSCQKIDTSPRTIHNQQKISRATT
jgi:hypothetical protein